MGNGMPGDGFGDLREWDRALRRIETLSEAGLLDHHQETLGWILRYRKNWRLLEAVLRAAGQLRAPSTGFIAAVLGVAEDENTYPDARVLALRALEQLLPRFRGGSKPDKGLLDSYMTGKIETLLGIQHPPRLREAIVNTLAAVRASQAPVFEAPAPAERSREQM